MDLLHLASSEGDLEIVELLLEEQEKWKNIDLLDPEQKTPLHYAAEGGHTDIVQILFNNKGNFISRKFEFMFRIKDIIVSLFKWFI